MGVLDDAIREHLELKRKHGAGDAEVEQQEQEALGPPQRTRAEQPSGEASAERAAEPEPYPTEASAERQPEPDPAEASAERRPEPAQESVERRPEPVEEPAAEAPVPDPGDETPAHGDPATEILPPAEPADPADPRSEEPDWGFEQVDDAPPPADGGTEEDVLEETPEFLQDTPEHDRLWFEQNPPRDFDFDEE
jgi:hypothetical protein